METKSVISSMEEAIIAKEVSGTEPLTLFDVKGAIISNCPKLPGVYESLLKCAIQNIDWEYIKNYLESPPLLETSEPVFEKVSDVHIPVSLESSSKSADASG